MPRADKEKDEHEQRKEKASENLLAGNFHW
jgi:hypothetical protein